MGKLVKTDDRVRFYQAHGAQGYDEVYLKRTHVIFRLPPGCGRRTHHGPCPVLVEGELGGRGRLTATSPRSKSCRMTWTGSTRRIAALPAKDFENRKAWGVWAENREVFQT